MYASPAGMQGAQDDVGGQDPMFITPQKRPPRAAGTPPMFSGSERSSHLRSSTRGRGDRSHSHGRSRGRSDRERYSHRQSRSDRARHSRSHSRGRRGSSRGHSRGRRGSSHRRHRGQKDCADQYMGKYFQGVFPENVMTYADLPAPLLMESLHIFDPARSYSYISMNNLIQFTCSCQEHHNQKPLCA